MTVKPMILVDSHEPKTIIKALGEFACRVPLEVGDYQFFTIKDERVVIERKAITDLLTSLSSGRLQEQISKTITLADIPILLIEGFMTTTRDGLVRHKTGVSRWRYNSVQNILLTAQLSGIYIVRSPNTFFTPKVLKSLYTYFQKETHDSLRKRARPVQLFSTGNHRYQVDMLTSVPGIGKSLAERMLERFGTPLATFMAGDAELLEVHGVGKKKIRGMRKVLMEKIVEEGSEGIPGR